MSEIELRRWQEDIRDLCCEHCPGVNIDGAGCDSGDPLDLTLAEVGQAIAHWEDTAACFAKEIQDLRATNENWRIKLAEAIVLLRDRSIGYEIASKRGNHYQDKCAQLREALQGMVDSYEHEASMNNPALVKARDVLSTKIEW